MKHLGIRLILVLAIVTGAGRRGRLNLENRP